MFEVAVQANNGWSDDEKAMVLANEGIPNDQGKNFLFSSRAPDTIVVPQEQLYLQMFIDGIR